MHLEHKSYKAAIPKLINFCYVWVEMPQLVIEHNITSFPIKNNFISRWSEEKEESQVWSYWPEDISSDPILGGGGLEVKRNEASQISVGLLRKKSIFFVVPACDELVLDGSINIFKLSRL